LSSGQNRAIFTSDGRPLEERQPTLSRQTVTNEMDWKDFWFANKWASNSFLQRKFGITSYDYENYFRNRSGLKELRDRFTHSNENLRAEELSLIFSDVWEYFWLEESLQKLPETDKEFLEFCIKYTQTELRNSPLSFLVDHKYFAKLPEAKSWKASGYTYLSYFFLNYEPTASRLRTLFAIPEMFRDTTLSGLSLEEATRFLSHLYLYHYKGLSESSADKSVRAAKERFYYSYKETGYFHYREARALGYSTTIPFNYAEVKERLKFTYGVELGFVDTQSLMWSKRKFKEIHPDLDLEKCAFCNAPRPDLHHLLFRSEYPELTYHRENIVPLCSTSHNAITRNRDPILNAVYRDCVAKWKAAAEGEKINVFSDILRHFHNSATGIV
jgi:hypothetical protein